MSTRTKLRLLGLAFLLLSLGSCVGTGFVPNRRDSLDEAAWFLLFAIGLTFFALSGAAFRVSWSHRPRRPTPEEAGGFPTWTAFVLAPLLCGAGALNPDLGPVSAGIGLGMGLAAASLIWFTAHLERVELDAAPGDDLTRSE